MRDAINKAYDSRKWKEKVKKMPITQVVAVYLRLRREGKIG